MGKHLQTTWIFIDYQQNYLKLDIKKQAIILLFKSLTIIQSFHIGKKMYFYAKITAKF